MDELLTELSRRAPAGPILGYLNFSDGRPDVKFRKAMVDVFAILDQLQDRQPWRTAGQWLARQAEELQRSGSAAFRDLGQARAILTLAFETLPAAYRRHHADLLAHQSDELLLTALFLARCCEVSLSEFSSGKPAEQQIAGALAQLNDYVGYRPIAVLETRPQTDYYPHEKVAPIPLYYRGVGVAPGRYANLLRPALDLLAHTEPHLLREASFALEQLQELTLDPRAVDHFHPVSKRPSMLFGEWDPHQIDSQGYYFRFVLRQPTLDALVVWSLGGDSPASLSLWPRPEPHPERLVEAAAVLAGTILMGAGMSGAGPTAYDSTVTLANLVGRIARYRDAFYQQLLDGLSGPHGQRLREEAKKRKQPFAGVRQFLNAAIASERALHLQERRLGLFYAAMGYPQAARARAARINAPSVRLSCAIRTRQTEASFAARANRPAETAAALEEAESLLHRGIECGALIDPWNILGFQGLFPTFPGREDSVRDPRAEELILTVGRQLELYAEGLSTAVSIEDSVSQERLRVGMNRFAEWWDRFATTTVSDLPKVNGAERAAAAEHVAKALALWKTGGSADPGFWRKHRDAFKTPAAYAQVIEVLLDQHDFRAALALLVTWLSNADTVPLQDPSASFFRLAFRWLRGVTSPRGLSVGDRPALIRRFFELLEANAEDRWHVSDLKRRYETPENPRKPAVDTEAEDEGFTTAYEEVTFKDSADDGVEGALADDGPQPFGDFVLDADTDRVEERLRFLAAIARLWRVAAWPDLWPSSDEQAFAAVSEWLRTARENLTGLRQLAEWFHSVQVPEPTGGLEAVIEYDRRRAVKGHLLDLTTQTCVEMAAAARSLTAVLIRDKSLPLPAPSAKTEASGPGGISPAAEGSGPTIDLASWEGAAVHLERAVSRGDAEAAQQWLPRFVSIFRYEPLLVSPPAEGGAPLPAIRAQTALQMLESLLARLPRIGLLRETYHLTRLARAMERNTPPGGRRVSSFDQLFRTAMQGVVETILHSAEDWPDAAAEEGSLADALQQIADSFQSLWLEHSQSLRLSTLESVLEAPEWKRMREFIRKYGSDLFTVRFLTLSNIRGILGQGVSAWLAREAKNDEVEKRPKLVEDWQRGVVTATGELRHFEAVLQALVEHYDEYRDYNTTTTQSDYGENLYILLDFLRLKVSYDRLAWRLRPLNLAHELLCRHGFDKLAAKWRDRIAAKTGKLAEELLAELSQREAEHGIRLRTIRDRLEERFLQPLRIDQAGARVAWAAAAAREGQGEDNPAFASLAAAIEPLAEQPSGVGLDVPAWLRRLEEELRKTQSLDPESDVELTDQFPFPELRKLSAAQLEVQLRQWETPIAE